MSKYPKLIHILFGHCGGAWGKHWKRHLYDKDGYCYRCGAKNPRKGDKKRNLKKVTG